VNFYPTGRWRDDISFGSTSFFGVYMNLEPSLQQAFGGNYICLVEVDEVEWRRAKQVAVQSR
jgi:hypothetical protein